MTLVIGRRFGDLTYLIADTGSYVPLIIKNPHPFTDPLAKVLVDKAAAIAYAGNTFYLSDVYSIISSAKQCDDTVSVLTEINRRSKGEIDFLVVNLENRGLTRIRNCEAELVETAYIGSQEAFTCLQKKRHKSELDQSTRFSMVKLPEASEESDRNFAADLTAFNLVLEYGLRDARGFAVPFFAKPNEHSFGTYAIATRRPLASNELNMGEPTLINWQGAPEGAFSINFGGNDRGFGCHIREGSICIEWTPECHNKPNVFSYPERQFIQAMQAKHGIQMIERS